MFFAILFTFAAMFAQDEEPVTALSAYTPPAQSCLARIGNLNSPNSDLPAPVDGATLKKTGDIENIRKKTKSGELIIIDGGNFVGWKFKGTKLSNLCFRGSDLTSTDWSKANASGIGFIDTKLTNANFERAIMPYILLRTTSMDGANAAGANFDYGQFDGSWSASISRLRLDGTSMRHFNFNCGVTSSDGCAFDRQKISLRSANLSSANLYNFTLWDGDFTGAKMNGAVVGLDQIGQLKDVLLDDNMLLRGGDSIRSIDRAALSVLRQGMINPKTASSPCKGNTAIISAILCAAGNEPIAEIAYDVRYLTDLDETDVTAAPALTRFDRKLNACIAANADEPAACLANVYASRRKELLDNASQPEWVDIQKRILFVKTDITLPSDISSNPDWRNIASIVASSAEMMMMVRDVDSEGQFALRAQIKDLNQGACSIVHDELGFDNNVLTAVGKVKQSGRKGRISVSLPVVQFYNDKAEISKSLFGRNNSLRSTITNCSAEISTAQMRAIPISAADFDQLWLTVQSNQGNGGL
jgi:uncharacterized protein YjbI with pentapeptide repeats